MSEFLFWVIIKSLLRHAIEYASRRGMAMVAEVALVTTVTGVVAVVVAFVLRVISRMVLKVVKIW